MKSKSFVVEQELPDAETALRRARAHAESSPPEACGCRHVQQVLPHALDLDFVKIVHPNNTNTNHTAAAAATWRIRHPVHALHVASQLDQHYQWSMPTTNNNNSRSREDPILYGEEQERLLAMQTPGFSEFWHTWVGPDPGMDRPEMPEAQHQALLNTMGLTTSANANASVMASPKTVSTTSPSLGVPAESLSASDAAVGTESKNADAADPALTPVVSNKAPSIEQQPPGATAAPFASVPVVPPTVASLPDSSSALPSLTTPCFMPAPLATTPSSSVPIVKAASATTNVQEQPQMQEQPPTDKPAAPTSSSLPAHDNQAMVPSTTGAPSAVGATAADGAATVSAQGTKPVSVPSTTTTSTTASTSRKPETTNAATTTTLVPNKIPEARYWALTTQEDQIRYLRRNFLAPRSSLAAAAAAKKKSAALKKRKTEAKPLVLTALPAWRQSPRSPIQLDALQEATWKDVARQAEQQVQVWMDHFRLARNTYWQELAAAAMVAAQKPSRQSRKRLFGSFLEEEEDGDIGMDRRCCQSCQKQTKKSPQWGWSVPLSPADSATSKDDSEWLGDDLMQCLECSFVGCAPRCVATRPNSPEHIVEHFFMSNHSMGVTCGPRARVYCFKCSDFIYHQVFDDERDRLDLVANLPWQAWKDHPVQRSFDAFRFLHVEGQGIIWRGMFATYPQLVLSQHVRMAKACRLRQAVMTGDLQGLPLPIRPRATELAALQNRMAPANQGRVRTPVGIYNLGNTCFQSAILQCLIHCVPVQRYFLSQVGHHHQACALYRELEANGRLGKKESKSSPEATKTDTDKGSEICLACELDKLMLRYYGSSMGFPVLPAVTELSLEDSKKTAAAKAEKEMIRGDPLATTEMLTATWKCSGMQHLAGYEQRDAHEFLHAFLEQLGKHTETYRVLMRKAMNVAVPNNVYMEKDEHTQDDIIKSLFEGTLRSVLVCQECGSKRIQTEHFMSISLPLSKEVQRMTAGRPGESNESVGRVKLSVERCLRHFTMPEMLADPVDCPSCAKKTPTKKQHVVSRLPKVLCLHLKRFDAAQNKKIEDFVSFPAEGLNMGSYLPHWCEVERVPVKDEGPLSNDVVPRIEYNLFGTVNHFGNLQSGHYVNNVKVDDQWYHCNDAHIVAAGEGDGEREVLQSDGAYLLFYYRQ